MLLAFPVSLIGAFFIAVTVFSRVWKSNVTILKLAGFSATFVAAFVLIMMGIGYAFPMIFGR